MEKVPAKRLTWDQYFLNIAEVTARRSPCLSRRVGAVIVKNNRILSTGYNGPPSGLEHCEKTCLSSAFKNHCRSVHAEQNAILYALKTVGDISNTILYSTTQPCNACSKFIITVGITKVVYREEYNKEQLGLKMMQEAGIEILKL